MDAAKQGVRSVLASIRRLRGQAWHVTRATFQNARADDLTGEAAKVAYFFFLSLFPLVLVLFALTGIVGGASVFGRITQTVQTTVPDYAWQFVASSPVRTFRNSAVRRDLNACCGLSRHSTNGVSDNADRASAVAQRRVVHTASAAPRSGGMMRPQFLSIFGSVAAFLLPLLACSRDTSRASRADSTVDSVAATVQASPPEAYASDGTLIVQASPALQVVLRAVADSFGSREAIRVELLSHPDATLSESASRQTADLVVVSADAIAKIFPDSTPWLLSFAEILPDSTRSDSVSATSRIGTDKPSRRRATSRRADSLRADSTRREAARLDSIRAERARADSARLLLLTMPANAKNDAVAERFVRYLLTEGRITLLQSGVRVSPTLVMRGGGAPPAIASLADTVASADSLKGAVRMPPQ